MNSDDALLDIAAAIAHGAPAGKVAIVPYYGGGMPQQAALVPRCPVLAHFGEQDTHILLDSVHAFAATRPEVQVQLYPAGHGFNCEQRGSYHAASAQLARDRTLAFLRQHVD